MVFCFLSQDLARLQGPGRGRELAAVLRAVPPSVEGAPVGLLRRLTQPPPLSTQDTNLLGESGKHTDLLLEMMTTPAHSYKQLGLLDYGKNYNLDYFGQ